MNASSDVDYTVLCSVVANKKHLFTKAQLKSAYDVYDKGGDG